MTVKRPTIEQMSDVVESLGMTMTKERVGEFISLMDGSFAAYDIVDQMADEILVVKYPRTPGYRPSPEENPLNAWYVKTDIQGAAKGKLKGKTVAVKDNVCVAGVPMMNGSSTLEGYMPNIDATVVTRLLDAGATIKGKARPIANAFVCRAAVTPAPSAPCTTRTNAAIPRVDHLRGAVRWSLPAKSISRSAATRAALSGCRLRSAGSTE
jgi:Asp-tRNA(Asn)/Glu-tRNA(Gln) amidotransferase A subunit family amidase